MKLIFCGAAGEVTGSSFLLETGSARILIDCGLFQGTRFAEKKNYSPFPFDPSTVDAMVLTHAHLDHCGRIPKLWKDGFRGKIYGTPATRDLAELIMSDAAEIMLHEATDEGVTPLYLLVDVATVMRQFEPLEYHEPTEIVPGVTVTLIDAGHILGSASIRVEAEGKSLVFSGDIGNHPVPIVRQPETPDPADYVVMESTYGSRLHESPLDRRVKLRSVIRQAVERKGTLLIPAFALERTQEILYELAGLVKEGSIPAIPIFLDSPLAIKATRVYHDYDRYLDDDALLLKKHGEQLFQFPALKVTESAQQSKVIKEVNGPKVIIAGSGMMEGGRILHHAKEFLPQASTMLLIVGYQAVGTLGRKLYDNQRRVRIMGSWVNVKAHIMAIGAYSAHADQAALIEWLTQNGKPPKRTFLVHGEAEGATALADLLAVKDYSVTIPKTNQSVEIE